MNSFYTIIKTSALKIVFSVLVTFLSTKGFAHGLTHERLDDLNHRLHHDPDNVALHIKKARTHRDAEEYEQAEAILLQLIESRDDLAEPYYWLADIHWLQSDSKNAESFIRKYLTLNQQSPRGNYLLASILYEDHRTKESLVYFDLAIAYDKNPAPQWILDRFNAQLRLGKSHYEKAKRDLLESIKEKGNLVGLVDALIKLELQLGQSEQALNNFELYPKPFQDSIKGKAQLAELYKANFLAQKAAKVYREVIELIEKMPVHRQQLSAFQEFKSHANESLEMLENSELR